MAYIKTDENFAKILLPAMEREWFRYEVRLLLVLAKSDPDLEYCEDHP